MKKKSIILRVGWVVKYFNHSFLLLAILLPFDNRFASKISYFICYEQLLTDTFGQFVAIDKKLLG